tara:strand:- start:48841 stop:49239 length:399 start_codon:yes stop_codon:yes gene_type:complete
MSKEYDVGYSKPPKSTQFKPGQSGNPKGRPSGIKNLSTDLQEELESSVLITENSQQREVTKQRAVIKTMFAKAMKGDSRAASTLITLILGLEQNNRERQQVKSLGAEDRAILGAYQEKLLAGIKQDEDSSHE